MGVTPKEIEYDASEGLWYFYDETWYSKVGPYETEEEVRAAFAVYCAINLGMGPGPNEDPKDITLRKHAHVWIRADVVREMIIRLLREAEE